METNDFIVLESSDEMTRYNDLEDANDPSNYEE